MNDGAEADLPFELIPQATTRHPEIFEALYILRDKLNQWIDRGEVNHPESPLEWVQTLVAVRAYNLYKATVALLELDFWEDALILVRSVFELLLNVEELHRVEEEQERNAVRFIMFDKLQMYLRHSAEHDYYVHSGRPVSDPDPIRKLDELAERLFPSFIVGRKHGKPKWAKSWHGRNVWELAETSKNRLRQWQYKTLYAYCSSFVHASPASVFSTHWSYENEAAWTTSLAVKLETDRGGITQTVSFLCLFTLEILNFVGTILPKYDPVIGLAVMERIFSLHGIKPPTPPQPAGSSGEV
jgi:hypothetical protein